MLKSWAICLGIALLYCLGFGWGRYAPAFIREPSLGPKLFALGTLSGALNALVIVPIVAAGAAVLLWLVPRFKDRLGSTRPAWLWPSILVLGIVSGVATSGLGRSH
jgi:hypothetical protein